jgi:hypothetical protein
LVWKFSLNDHGWKYQATIKGTNWLIKSVEGDMGLNHIEATISW